MSRRKWLIRGFGYSALGGLVACGLAWAFTTQPEVVRQIVKDRLVDRFVHVNVTMQSAHARLLGGIAVQELRLARSDGLDHSDFLYVPNMVIYHDKEKLFGGQLSLRKMELSHAQFRIVRDRDGHFNIEDIAGKTDLNEPAPALVVRHGSLSFEDHSGPVTGPLFEIRDLELTVVNDPLPILQIEATGKADVLGPIKFHARLRRDNGAGTISCQLTKIPVSASLIGRLCTVCPTLSANLRNLTARGEIEARITHNPESATPFTYEVRAKLHEGRWSHGRVPGTFEGIELDARCVNGRVPEASLTAALRVETPEPGTPDPSPGSIPSAWPRPTQAMPPARFALTAKDLNIPQTPLTEEPDIEDLAREISLRVDHLPVTERVLKSLPASLDWLAQDYAPSGPASFSYSFRRPVPGDPGVNRWLFNPEGMRACCVEFPYPVTDARGTIEVDNSALPDRKIRLDLTGSAGDSPVKVVGHVHGSGKYEVAVDITGEGLRLDQKVMNALTSQRARDVVKQFLPEGSRTHGLDAHPMGRVNYRVQLRRPLGQPGYRNTFTLDFVDAEVQYDQFPYSLEHVTGRLILHPDRHWECQGVSGSHAGGKIFVEGFSRVLPTYVDSQFVAGQDVSTASRPQEIHVKIRGEKVRLDSELEQALTPVHASERRPLQHAWQTLGLSGQMSFNAEVIDHPEHPQDIAVGVAINGCTMKPTFFPYALEDVSATVRYGRGWVVVNDFHARHGAKTGLGMKLCQVQLIPRGGFMAWFTHIESIGLVPDSEFLTALPDPLRRGLEPLGLHDPVSVQTRELVVDASNGLTAPLKVWWDGLARLKNAHFRAGVETTEATGEVACKGHFDGQALHGLEGTVFLERATVFNQPLTNVSAQMQVMRDSPNSLRLRQIKADVFGGTLGGEALLQLGPVFAYELNLVALQVQLEEFGKQNLGAQANGESPLSGPARAALYLRGEGADLLGLKGMGQVDVAQGKMGRLPLLLGLLKSFGLRVPDRTAFEEAHLHFAIEGPQVKVQNLDLIGNAISLHGEGTVDVDGKNLNLDFSATPGQLKRLLPGGLDIGFEAISEQILKIKMRGQVTGPNGVRFEKELVPAVSEPLKKVMGRGT
jgi:AsmA-like C-terminal region